MQTEEVALSRIAENANNPRTITEEKFKKLVKSLLVFPRMLTLRPIVVDETMTVLGGNMRLKALKHIVTMDKDTLRFTIAENDQFTSGEIDALIKYWDGWRKNPVAPIVNAADLTEAQKKEFIIKDNVGFGDWDTNMLANGWNTDLLKDWGVESFNNYDISGFFDEDDKTIGNEEKTAQNENLIKITIEIPSEMDDSKQEIIDSVRELLKDYKGVKVYE